MTNKFVPEGAVEAACAFVASGSDRIPNSGYIRQLLEAAAPHMLAGAWEAGWASSSEYDAYLEIGGEEPSSSNPYEAAK